MRTIRRASLQRIENGTKRQALRTASSSAEIVFNLIHALGTELFDEPVATSLLAGIISKTAVFQNQLVTPHALTAAAQLLNLGGRRDEVVKHLYQTKSVNTLKIWGRALEHLETAADGLVIISVLSQNDLTQSGTSADEASGVIAELLSSSPEAKLICLCIEGAGGIDFYLQHPAGFSPDQAWPTLQTINASLARGHISGKTDEARNKLKKLLEESASK